MLIDLDESSSELSVGVDRLKLVNQTMKQINEYKLVELSRKAFSEIQKCSPDLREYSYDSYIDYDVFVELAQVCLEVNSEEI